MRYSMVLVLSVIANLCIADDNNNLETNYQAYNHRMSLCSNLKNRQITITDSYLLSLSDLERKVVLFEANKAAMQRCYAEQQNAYTLTLVNQAIASGNRKPLDDFIQLRQHDKTDARAKAILDKLDQAELNRVMQLDVFYFPFDYASEGRRGD